MPGHVVTWSDMHSFTESLSVSASQSLIKLFELVKKEQMLYDKSMFLFSVWYGDLTPVMLKCIADSLKPVYTQNKPLVPLLVALPLLKSSYSTLPDSMFCISLFQLFHNVYNEGSIQTQDSLFFLWLHLTINWKYSRCSLHLPNIFGIIGHFGIWTRI